MGRSYNNDVLHLPLYFLVGPCQVVTDDETVAPATGVAHGRGSCARGLVFRSKRGMPVSLVLTLPCSLHAVLVEICQIHLCSVDKKRRTARKLRRVLFK